MKNLTLFLSILFIFSCSENSAVTESNAAKSPEEIALEYVQLQTNFDTNGIKELLSNEDRKYFKPKEYGLSEFIDNESLTEIREAFSPYIKYKILNSEIQDTTAQITIIESSPDLTGLMGKFLQASMASALNNLGDGESSDNSKELIASLQNELSKDNDLPRLEVEKVVNLVLEDGEWRVFQNLKLETILIDAREFEKEKDYAKAMTKVSTALEIDPMNDKANNMADSIQEKIDEERAKTDYFSKIEIFEFEARIFNKSSYSDGTPGVKFALKNNGDKTLSDVDVIVYFLDSDGRPIAEETFYPVSSGIYCYTNCDPLKPNYVWRQGDKFYSIDTLGPEWSGEATIEIKDIQFAE
jgi:hypothetical protein